MHAARRQQPDDMRRAAAFLQLGDELAQRREARQRAVGDRPVDARQILHDDPAGAEIGVADLGIAHLAVGQPDIMLAGVETGMRPARASARARPAWRRVRSRCRRRLRAPPSRRECTAQAGGDGVSSIGASTGRTRLLHFCRNCGNSTAPSRFAHHGGCRTPRSQSVSIPTVRQWWGQSDDLVAQLGLAAPEPVEVLAQDLDDVVFVAPGFSRRVRGYQHVLHAP